MTIIKPFITEIVSYKGIVDEKYKVWSSKGSYKHGDYIIYDDTIYRIKGDVNTTKNPYEYIKDPIETTKIWFNYGKINHLRALDDKNSSLTNGKKMEYVLNIGKSDTIAFFNLKKVLDITIELQIKKDNKFTTVKTYNIKPIAYTVSNILEYIDNDITYKPDIHQMLPLYFEEKRVILTIENGDNEVGIGNIVVGKRQFIDNTEAKIKGKIIDYSITKTNKAGFTEVKKGISLRLIDINIITKNIIRVQGIFRDLIGKSIAVIGVENADIATVFGFLKEIKPSIHNMDAEFGIEVQEIA